MVSLPPLANPKSGDMLKEYVAVLVTVVGLGEMLIPLKPRATSGSTVSPESIWSITSSKFVIVSIEILYDTRFESGFYTSSTIINIVYEKSVKSLESNRPSAINSFPDLVAVRVNS